MTVPPPYSPLRNHAFEVGVVERVIFDLHGE